MGKTVVILETMWGGRVVAGLGYTPRAPRWFHINPDNFTGRRLHRFLGHSNFWVTNACPEYVVRATQHGRPDSKWLSANLQRIKDIELLLVCGRIAQETFQLVPDHANCQRIIFLPHPAARNWTSKALEQTTRYIQDYTSSLRLSLTQGIIKAYRY